MSQGNDRRAIMRDDADRNRRLAWLARTVKTCRRRLRAFALMDNHEHLFVETPEPNLSAGMQYLMGQALIPSSLLGIIMGSFLSWLRWRRAESVTARPDSPWEPRGTCNPRRR